MTSIKLMVAGAQAWASVTGPLTSGMVGVPVTIEYDEAWDGLTKNLMCRCSPWGSDSGEVRAILNVGENAVVAHEVMQPDMFLHLGVEGFSADGKLVIPSTWARCGKIEYGATTCEDSTTDPELPVWNQLQMEMEKTKEYVLTPEQAVNIQTYAQTASQAAQEAQQAAEEAKQAVASGLYYIPVVSQTTDTTLTFAFKPSVPGTPIPKPVTVTLPAGSSGSGENAGLTADERSTLVAAVNAIGTFNVGNGRELIDAFNAAWGNEAVLIPATGITLSAASLSFREVESQMLTATVEPGDTTDEVVWSTSDSGVATVTGGLVTPVADGECVITAAAGSVSAACAVSVAFEVEVTYYTITNNLTNCVSNNNTASIVEGGSYSATLTADDGYTLEGAAVSVAVNGEDVTDTAYSDGVISIPNVVGNVVITAAAAEESTDSGEITMLKNISFDGTSYLDTGVVPESIDYRYVLGIQFPGKDIVTNKNIGGISMRDQSSPAESAYWDIYWYCTVAANSYNADVPRTVLYEQCMSLVNGGNGLSAGQDKGDGASTQPFDYPVYYSMDNGSQAMWLNEECTEPPVAGHFAAVTTNTDFTNQSYYTDDEHPIDSIWLGKVHVTGIMGSLATEANTYAGVKFYCFKVYDSDDILIADMRPAKQGSSVGMWDNVRSKFYPAAGTANYEEVSE